MVLHSPGIQIPRFLFSHFLYSTGKRRRESGWGGRKSEREEKVLLNLCPRQNWYGSYQPTNGPWGPEQLYLYLSRHFSLMAPSEWWRLEKFLNSFKILQLSSLFCDLFFSLHGFPRLLLRSVYLECTIATMKMYNTVKVLLRIVVHNGVFDFYDVYLQTKIYKCKPVKFSHTELKISV